MKRMILCEGKTDAILISYFLIRKYGWSYTDKPPKITLPVDNSKMSNESLAWYKHDSKPEQEICIWGAGSYNEIAEKLKEVLQRNRRERDEKLRFSRVVLFVDNDTRGTDVTNRDIIGWLQEAGLKFSNDNVLPGKWAQGSVDLIQIPANQYPIHILPIIIPPESTGNLEVFLVECIKSQSPIDSLLVDEARKFIDGFPSQPYLPRPRHRTKACLSTVLAVISPERVFSSIDERLKCIPWENIEEAERIYGLLSDL